MLPQGLKNCPKSNKSPNLVTLISSNLFHAGCIKETFRPLSSSRTNIIFISLNEGHQYRKKDAHVTRLIIYPWRCFILRKDNYPNGIKVIVVKSSGCYEVVAVVHRGFSLIKIRFNLTVEAVVLPLPYTQLDKNI